MPQEYYRLTRLKPKAVDKLEGSVKMRVGLAPLLESRIDGTKSSVLCVWCVLSFHRHDMLTWDLTLNGQQRLNNEQKCLYYSGVSQASC